MITSRQERLNVSMHWYLKRKKRTKQRLPRQDRAWAKTSVGKYGPHHQQTNTYINRKERNKETNKKKLKKQEEQTLKRLTYKYNIEKK